MLYITHDIKAITQLQITCVLFIYVCFGILRYSDLSCDLFHSHVFSLCLSFINPDVNVTLFIVLHCTLYYIVISITTIPFQS